MMSFTINALLLLAMAISSCAAFWTNQPMAPSSPTQQHFVPINSEPNFYYNIDRYNHYGQMQPFETVVAHPHAVLEQHRPMGDWHPEPYKAINQADWFRPLPMEQRDPMRIVRNMENNEIEETKRPRPMFKGVKGELNVKWSIMPIFSKRWNKDAIRNHRKSIDEVNDDDKQQQYPTLHLKTEMLTESGTEEPRLRRTRRQLSFNWGQLMPTMKKLIGNTTGAADHVFGQQVTRQWRSSFKNASNMMSGMLQTVQNNFKKLIRTK